MSTSSLSPSIASITSSPSPASANSTSNTPSKAFTAKDLVALLKNLEGDITLTENNLKEELEKRRKYRIDDSRRTHNYDQFITTFLAMLAERGKLAPLVERELGLTSGVSNCESQKKLNSPPVSPSALIATLMASMNNVNKPKKKKKRLRKHSRKIKKV